MDDVTLYADKYILKHMLEAQAKFNEWQDFRNNESGMQVKRCRTDGGSEYTYKQFPE